MKKYYLVLLVCCLAFVVQAQIVTTSPQFPVEGKEIIVTFDATQGTKGLMGYTGDVYAHTGVITNKSISSSDWKYAPTWGDNSPKYKMTSLGNDKWQLKIIPDIRAYYGVVAGEAVKQMAFVFRSADKSKEGKDVGGKDILVDVHEEGLTVRFDLPLATAVVNKGESLTMKASASIAADMKLFVGTQQLAAQSNVKEITATHSFAQAGSFEIRVEATAGGKIEMASQTVNVLGETTQSPLPKGVRPGINYPSDTQVTLVLQAPKKKTVYVVGDFNDWKLLPEYQLKQDGEYFWIALSGLTKNAEYAFQYVVDGSIYIADPYADKVLDPWNDSYIEASVYPDLKPYPVGKAEGIVSVLQTGQKPYSWQVTDFKRPAKEQLIAYEMLIRDFTKQHSFNAAKERISYLKTLGVNAIELMPVNEFEGNSSWGYNPSFFFAVDKYYGTKNDMKAFVDECHKQGMAVIIDLVLNHSFGQSPFYLLYKDTDGNPSADNPWYNQKSNLTTLQWGYDFNHESTYTRALVDSVASFWMNEYQIDGFRYDFTKGFSNTPQKDEWANTYDPARIANLKRMNEQVQKRKPGAFVIFEHLAELKEEAELGNTGILLWRNMNNAYCQTAMGWTTDNAFTGLYAGTSNMPAGSLVGYMESHDEERTSFKAWKWGVDGVKGDITGTTPSPADSRNLSTRMKRLATNAAFCLTVPGPKMIWQFGEVGYDYSIRNNSDGTILGEGDAYRTDPKPIRWDYYDVSERKGLYDAYSKLLGLRHSYPEIFAANATFSWKVGISDWNNGRFITLTAGDKAIVIAGNFTASTGNYSVIFPKTGMWYDLMDQSSTLSVTSTTLAESVVVPAHEFRLYTNFEPILTGIEAIDQDVQKPIAYYNKQSNELMIAEEATLVEIYSVNGMTVQRQENCTSVGLSVLPVGCYVARIHLSDGQMQTCKIMK